MFGFISIRQQLIKERSRNLKNEQENARNTANIDYIAMMTDVEIPAYTEEDITDEQNV
ncbi:MAG: hypothetical protein Q4E74_00795 [Ruminococcus sp.]|nr:hypothetical protein [Ruminococcus sp.]